MRTCLVRNRIRVHRVINLYTQCTHITTAFAARNTLSLLWIQLRRDIGLSGVDRYHAVCNDVVESSQPNPAAVDNVERSTKRIPGRRVCVCARTRPELIQWSHQAPNRKPEQYESRSAVRSHLYPTTHSNDTRLPQAIPDMFSRRYSSYHYSHPPLVERLRAIEIESKGAGNEKEKVQ